MQHFGDLILTEFVELLMACWWCADGLGASKFWRISLAALSACTAVAYPFFEETGLVLFALSFAALLFHILRLIVITPKGKSAS